MTAAQTAAKVTRTSMVFANIFRAVAVEGVGQLGPKLGLDPGLTNLLSLSVAAIGGGVIENPKGGLEAAFKNIKPQLFSSLASYGVEKLGTSLGLDPRLSSLIGTPISGLVGHVADPTRSAALSAIEAVGNGLLRGVTSLGIEYLTQKADLDPLLGSLTSRAITGAIEGALGGAGIFQGVYEGFKQSVLNIARLGISGDDPWSQAQYLQRVQNFSNIVQTRGFGQAIEDSATQILTEDSISSILRTTNPITQRFFQSVKEFFDYKNTANQFETLVVDGKTYKKILLPNGDYQIFTEDRKDVVEIKKGNQVLRGTFARSDNGEWGLKTGTIIVHHPNGVTTTSIVENGKRTSVDIFNPNKILSESPDFTIRLNSGDLDIQMDSNGNLVNGLIQNNYTGEGFEIKDAQLVRYLAGAPLSSNFEEQFMSQFGVASNDLSRVDTYEDFTNAYPELTIGGAVPETGLSFKDDTRFFDGFMDEVTKLKYVKYAAEMVNALETQMGGARLERVVRIVNGEAREYVKVFGQQNNFFKVAGRWYRIDNPAVAKYFSGSAAIAGKLTQGVGMTASIVIAQNVLDRLKNGEDIFTTEFGFDAGVDLAVAVGTGAIAAAATAGLVSLGAVSAVPVAVAGTTIAIGATLSWAANYVIDEYNIKEWLQQRAEYFFNAG